MKDKNKKHLSKQQLNKNKLVSKSKAKINDNLEEYAIIEQDNGAFDADYLNSIKLNKELNKD